MSDKDRLDLPKLKLGWDDARTERLLASVHTRIDRRKGAWRAAMASTAIAAVVCASLVALRPKRTAVSTNTLHEAPAQLASPNAIHLGDGSEITLDLATSEIRVVEESASRIAVELVRGTSRYAVVPNADRAFEVHAGSVTVTVVGTEFIVQRRGETTWVDVSRGKVRVTWGEERAFLVAGESGTFPRANAQSAAGSTSETALPNAADDAHAAGDEIDAPLARGPQLKQVYRSRVARKDYRGAYVVLSRNPTLAGDSVEDLLVAADVARLSDHPSEAVPYLQRVIREHPRDERAPLAGFTLGRTLGGLGRTEEAMNMFGRVRSAWPNSPLAEDALLRQAEAASQLGDFGAARRLAEQYDRDYPNGRRRSEVRRYARLE